MKTQWMRSSKEMQGRQLNAAFLFLLLCSLLFSIALPVAAQSAVSSIITVNSTADPGDGVCDQAECTLREAIVLANGTAERQTIAFNIPGPGPHTIQPSSALPTITDAVIMDGYSQPGAQPATSPDPAALDAVILVEIDGSGLTPGQNTFGEGLRVDSTASVIQGLAINRFDGPAIIIYTGAGNLITGNFLGTDASGTQAFPNDSGITVNALAPSDSPNRLEGNLIGGNGSGIRIDQASNILVERNRIGSGLNGAPLGNTGSGIFIAESAAVTIGGNLIAHNSSGVFTSRAGPRLLANTIMANGIGVNYATDGACPVEGNRVAGNQGDGMNLRCGSASNIRNNQLTDNGGDGLTFAFRAGPYQVEGNTITGNGGHGLALSEPTPATPANWVVVSRNTIAHNGKDGITVLGGSTVWQFAMFSDNAIYDNGELGIDLGDDGVTVNDGGSGGPPDSDSGPNFLLNYPSLGIVGSDGAEIFAYATGWLHNRTLGVGLFASPTCDPSGYGEGERPVGRATLTEDEFGRLINHWFTFPVAVPPGSVLTATATDFFIPSGDSRVSFTSEFSPCRIVAGVINHHLKLVGVTTSYDPALTWPRAPAGTFTITGTFQNIASTPLAELFYKVKTLTNNNRLVDVIGGPGDPIGVGAVQVGPKSIAAGETFSVLFRIGLAERKPFTFLVDTYGVSSAGYATTAAATAETSFTYAATTNDLQDGVERGNQLYLPLISR